MCSGIATLPDSRKQSTDLQSLAEVGQRQAVRAPPQSRSPTKKPAVAVHAQREQTIQKRRNQQPAPQVTRRSHQPLLLLAIPPEQAAPMLRANQASTGSRDHQR